MLPEATQSKNLIHPNVQYLFYGPDNQFMINKTSELSCLSNFVTFDLSAYT